VVAPRVEDLPAGVYRYLPAGHALAVVADAGTVADLAAAALGQECVERAAAVIALAADAARTTRRYGERGRRYVHLEAGHAAQNVCLAAVALGLGAVVVGAFDDAGVRRVLRPAHAAEPLCLVAVGRPAQRRRCRPRLRRREREPRIASLGSEASAADGPVLGRPAHADARARDGRGGHRRPNEAALPQARGGAASARWG
jgi:SagB-type dehydrogenase family enzyme